MAIIHRESHRATSKSTELQNIPIWNAWILVLKKFTFIHDRLSRYLEEAKMPEWMAEKRPPWCRRASKKGTAPNDYRPITCQSMMRKTLRAQIRQNYYSLLSRGHFLEGQKLCQKGTRGIGDLLYIDKLISTSLRRAKRDAKCSQGVHWLQKELRYVPANLAKRLSKNMQDIRQSHKFHHRSHEKLESGIDCRRKNFNPVRYLPSKCTFNITICNRYGTTQSHTQKMHWELKFTQSQEKINYIMTIVDIELFSKIQKIWKF